MIQVHLEDLVSSAEIRRKEYFNYFHDEDIVGTMNLTIQERHGAQVQTEDFDSLISESLQKRGINYLADLREFERDSIAILGETYHFVHKFTLRNHEFRNPMPLLKLTFEALEPIDSRYAAKFIYEILSLMDKDSTAWRSDIPRVANFFMNILPKLFQEYKSALEKIEDYKGDGEVYGRKRKSLDSFYKKSLDIALEILKESVKNKIEFYWGGFERSRGQRGITLDLKSVYIINDGK